MERSFSITQLRDVSENALAFREGSREEAKKQRISQQNSQQFNLLTRKQLPPKNFESNEDSLDGFDLAEFEPR